MKTKLKVVVDARLTERNKNKAGRDWPLPNMQSVLSFLDDGESVRYLAWLKERAALIGGAL
jgi:hypothetical protein